MASDKWREDLLPVIERSKYRDLMPTKGGGSRGGKTEAIQFLNGATLKFMSGGGGDKSRAGFTSRVVVITETDGMDQAGTRSREADKITQLEARTRAYGSRKRIYLECTVSTQEGRTWQEYQQGTQSRILLPCPHCNQYVVMEREQLHGWKQAKSQAEARIQGQFICGDCGAPWTETDRAAANQNSLLVHSGQNVDETSNINGDSPATDTLGFRWSAAHNLFLSAGELAADEWRASRSPDEEIAEREMRQFVWCLPVLPNRWEETALQAEQITQRLSGWPQGVLPPGTEYVSTAIDLGKYLCHWITVAWQPDASCHIVDYGRIEVASVDLGVERALMLALTEYQNLLLAGYPLGIDEQDPTRVEQNPFIPNQAWIDAGYMTELVYKFCRVSQGCLPAVGRSVLQVGRQQQDKPVNHHTRHRRIGEGYSLNYLQEQHITLAEVNADHWKSWVHQRLETPLDQPGAMTLFQTPSHEHLSLAKHLTSERKVEEFLPGRGIVTRWERIRKNNHWFDALYNACAAGHASGVRLLEEERVKPEPRRKMSELAEDKRRQRGVIDYERWDEMRRRWG